MGADWLLPLLGALVAYPFFVSSLRGGRPGEAAALMACWAVFLSLAAILATWAAPEVAAQVIWKGPEYAAEMMGWVRTGGGPEGSPSLYLPQHALHFAAFNAACLATAGLAALYMGAALLNYMNYYVAVLALEAEIPWMAASLGWPPWAVLRVAGFILVSIPLSRVLLRRAWGYRIRPDDRYLRYYMWGLGLVLLDAALKAVLAPHWRALLLKSL